MYNDGDFCYNGSNLFFRDDVVKAYQIKIQLEGLDVWRRVVMPAEVSFNALHRVIQYSMGSLRYVVS